MNCPWCDKKLIYSDCEMVYPNCEAYGRNTFKTICPHCNAPITVKVDRIVVLKDIYKGKHKITDWGQETSYKGENDAIPN